MPICNDITKDREIRFTCSPVETDQAKKAVQLLNDIAGIEHVSPSRPHVLRVRYDVRLITLQMLESALIDVGFELQHSLAARVKREIIAYCEDALRSSLGIERDQQKNSSLTLNKSSRPHLDPRPDNWRKYV
ncbi:MAG: hypothetical protein OEZ15_09005 [Gammaproteobacteria bacterium]|nr:hypothetical protein [Gammaproteobacteria bacterium]